MKQPQFIAHRGFWNDGKTAENSVRALQNAQELQIYGSEFDVRMSRDGVPIVFHDPEIGNLEIAENDYSDLFSAYRKSEKNLLTTLENFIKLGVNPHSDLKLIVEIKDTGNKDFEHQTVLSTVYLIEKYRLLERVEFISFSLYICQILRDLQPDISVKYLNGDLSPEAVKNFGLDGINYEFSVFRTHPEWIAQAHDLQLTTGCWTVNSPEKFLEISELGIDFITTDRPDFFIDFI